MEYAAQRKFDVTKLLDFQLHGLVVSHNRSLTPYRLSMLMAAALSITVTGQLFMSISGKSSTAE